MLDEPFLSEFGDNSHIRERVCGAANASGDQKEVETSGKWAVSVKSFYNFLIDGGLRCQDVKFFLHSWCPKKVNLLNWLAWKNKLLSLERLVQRGCNRLPTDTCVLCCAGTESIDHLFVHCAFC